MCPRRTGIFAIGFGFSVSAGAVRPIWGAGLRVCTENLNADVMVVKSAGQDV